MPTSSRTPSHHGLPAIAGMTVLALALGTNLPAAPSVERRSLAGSSVAIYDLAGRVTVEPAASGDVEVEVTRGGADGGQLRIENGPIGSWQTLRVVFPANRVVYGESGDNCQVTVTQDGRFDDQKLMPAGNRRHSVTVSGRDNGLDAYADLHVRVPAGRHLALFLAVGDMTINNVDGELTVKVASADVTARGTRGSLDVDAGSGRLHVRDAAGQLRLDTGSGSTMVRGMRGDRLVLDSGSGSVTVLDAEVDELRADTGSGSVEIADLRAPDIALDSGSGTVRLNLLRGPLRTLDIDSGSGGITVGVPDELDASFDVQTGSGGVRIGVPHQVEHQEHGRIRGRFGAGHGRIHIESGSGGVRIVPRSTSSYLLPGAGGGGVGALLRYGIA